MNDGWRELQSWPSLAAEEVHVWLAHLPSALGELENLRALLRPEELERARRFRTALLRERWELTRGILRSLLARYAGIGAREISFTLGAQGKPGLAPPGEPGLHFNTSHSGDYAAFAFTRQGDIGVDIEQRRGEMLSHQEIAHRFFTPGEFAQLESVPESEQVRAFFTLWTRKEAFVKARGDGVSSGLDQFAVSLAEPRMLTITGGDATQWWMTAIPEIAGYAGAAVVKATACHPRFWRWNPAAPMIIGEERGQR